MRCFLWKAAHGAILTNDRRLRLGVSMNNICPVCTNQVENLFHTFRDCDHAKEVWNKILISNTSNFLSNQEWDEWLYSNMVVCEMDRGANWPIIFGVTLDSLWWRRNEVVFNNEVMSATDLSFRIRKSMESIILCMASKDRVKNNLVVNQLYN